MIKFYTTDKTSNKLKEIDKEQKNCWIHLEAPDTEEVNQISELTGIDKEHLRAALDDEEVAHLDSETKYKIVVMDIPKTIPGEAVNTRPLAVIATDNYLVSVCSVRTTVLSDFFEGHIKNADTSKREKLVYQLMLNNTRRFLFYLRQIDKSSDAIQKHLSKSMKNEELLQLVAIQKSLVFFSASLSANYTVFQKIFNHAEKATAEEKDILEDVILDSKQAISMCSVYREIIKSTMDAFAAVVNNNQNIIMKFLAAITIVLSIPMVIASWWGMNTGVPWQGTMWGFWIAVGISLLLTGIISLVMAKKKMF